MSDKDWDWMRQEEDIIELTDSELSFARFLLVALTLGVAAIIFGLGWLIWG